MTKILFFDIDGTLYNSEKKIPASSKDAIKEARKNGYEIAIATGRAPFMIQPIIDELEIDTYITFNGQYIVY
ncbi:Cof-type HAD-IIB family hydrolase, partial [Butyricicoccus sp. 1XD8-22]